MKKHATELAPASLLFCAWLALAAFSAAAPVRPGFSQGGEVREATKPTSSSRVPGVLLITLDTTRADALGSYGGGARTPHLDSLARSGVLYRTAVAPSPLTLPSHASLLTGAAPTEHGILDNGTAALGDQLPTLATEFSRHGFATGAFVASRVLDRRFGLARGFDAYDDQMAAENRGEYGYPERSAAAVVRSAITWVEQQQEEQPLFLWLHFYDPHAPYAPPDGSGPPSPGEAGDSAAADQAKYWAEIAYVDGQIGRLLDAVDPERRWLVAAVGDHGESLGEHGERGHGVFLYRAVLEVPLILSGPVFQEQAPAGSLQARVVDGAVASRRVAPSLLRLAGFPVPPEMGQPLPGLGERGARAAAEGVYSQSTLPQSAYGWSRLRSLTESQWKFIEAPEAELYDLEEDPKESRNVIKEQPQQAKRMRSELLAREQVEEAATHQAEFDPELAASLRSLGYLSGVSGGRSEGPPIDPKEGMAWLKQLEESKRMMTDGRSKEARNLLEDLVARNPDNVPFLSQLARARAATGDNRGAESALRRAIELNPELDFLHANLGDLYRMLKRTDDAIEAYRMTATLNPRSARAWLAIAELAALSGDAQEEERVLLEAHGNGTSSASVGIRLGQIFAAKGQAEASDQYFKEASELTPSSIPVWMFWGRAADARNDRLTSIECYSRLVQLAPGEASFALRLGQLYLEHGNTAAARFHLRRVQELAPGSELSLEALRALEGLGS